MCPLGGNDPSPRPWVLANGLITVQGRQSWRAGLAIGQGLVRSISDCNQPPECGMASELVRDVMKCHARSRLSGYLNDGDARMSQPARYPVPLCPSCINMIVSFHLAARASCPTSPLLAGLSHNLAALDHAWLLANTFRTRNILHPIVTHLFTLSSWTGSSRTGVLKA